LRAQAPQDLAENSLDESAGKAYASTVDVSPEPALPEWHARSGEQLWTSHFSFRPSRVPSVTVVLLSLATGGKKVRTALRSPRPHPAPLQAGRLWPAGLPRGQAVRL